MHTAVCAFVPPMHVFPRILLVTAAALVGHNAWNRQTDQ